ncbi:flagellar basal body-associated protein FliL [Caldicellulosiruptor owensensis OL]|uniref:Flagellar protein FliL n=1 Tax=Caldicellulosiruptor owensensis (strain ATCC 700167 / DSM 13100 / OL) TaxID=632518 RepID=E4Q521_CALOW|nr:flagellar basal body-associated FliL family protein [Caldicellulosiruptor owensensis]ADQ05381.1 flagellar basal body-associated protein FliL [Caldicellulosiruptor owensensis OL]
MKGEKMNSVILILLVLLLLMMLGMGIGFLTVIKNLSPASSAAKATSAEKKPEKLYTYDVSDGKGLMSNLQDTQTNAGRIIRVTVQLEVTDKKLSETLKEKNIVIADIIDSVLRSKTADELLKPEGKEKVRKEIKDRLNEIFDNKVYNVNFGEFIIQ